MAADPHVSPLAPEQGEAQPPDWRLLERVLTGLRRLPPENGTIIGHGRIVEDFRMALAQFDVLLVEAASLPDGAETLAAVSAGMVVDDAMLGAARRSLTGSSAR